MIDLSQFYQRRSQDLSLVSLCNWYILSSYVHKLLLPFWTCRNLLMVVIQRPEYQVSYVHKLLLPFWTCRNLLMVVIQRPEYQVSWLSSQLLLLLCTHCGYTLQLLMYRYWMFNILIKCLHMLFINDHAWSCNARITYPYDNNVDINCIHMIFLISVAVASH